MSLIEIGDGVIEVLATSGDNHLGGDDFDERLADYLADEFKRTEKIDLEARQGGDAPRARGGGKSQARTERPDEHAGNPAVLTQDANGPHHLQM